MTEDQVRDALRQVIDPEMGIDVVELGLVYGIDIGPGSAVGVRLTMTSPACPLGEYLRDSAHNAISALVPDAGPVDVELVLDPPWTPALMSPDARRQLGWPEEG